MWKGTLEWYICPLTLLCRIWMSNVDTTPNMYAWCFTRHYTLRRNHFRIPHGNIAQMSDGNHLTKSGANVYEILQCVFRRSTHFLHLSMEQYVDLAISKPATKVDTLIIVFSSFLYGSICQPTNLLWRLTHDLALP